MMRGGTSQLRVFAHHFFGLSPLSLHAVCYLLRPLSPPERHGAPPASSRAHFVPLLLQYHNPQMTGSPPHHRTPPLRPSTNNLI